MSTITSLYIPHIDKHFNAEFIADVFSNNGLAQVSRVYLKSINNYNRAYIQINSWQETEAAYSFIKRLRNSSVESRLIYSDDNWWSVNINKYPNIFNSKNKVLTVFTKTNEVDDDCSNVAVGNIEEYNDEEFVTMDAEKTKALRDIVATFKENHEKNLMEQEEADAAEFEAYVREINWTRNVYNTDMWDAVFC